MIVSTNSPMLAQMIDNHIMAESPFCEEVPDNMAQCRHCGNLIAHNDTYYSIDGWEFCSECDWKVRGILDEHLNELLGRHVSDEALDAIMDDCEQVWQDR